MMTARQTAHEAIVLRRSYPVPPPAVWRAWVDAAVLRVWFGQADAPEWQAQMDVRIGGRYRLWMRGPDGRYYEAYGEYREVVPGRKLVFTWTWKQGADTEALITVVLKEAGGGTELEFMLDPVIDPREREAWRADFERLEQLLQEGRT